jgi:signal transduction histidine kinase
MLVSALTRSRSSAALLLVAIAGAASAAAINLTIGVRPTTGGEVAGYLLVATVTVGAGMLGRLIVRRTRNPIGWIFLVSSAAAGLVFASEAYVQAAFRPVPRDLRLTPAAGWLNNVAILMMVLPLPMLLVLFPTGEPRSRRWRWLIPLWWTGVACVLVWAGFKPAAVYGSPDTADFPGIRIDNPMPIQLPSQIAQPLLTLGVVAVLLTGLLGLVTLLMRFRGARGEERQQLRLIAFDATLVVVLMLTLLVLDATGANEDGGFDDLIWGTMAALLLAGLPITVAIAVLKYRLYDIDFVIRKTVVYAVLAGFISLVYVAIVVGLGSLFADDLVLSIAATAVVAVAFQPVRERANRFANRLVYGKRATPYEVLARFSERVGGTYATEDVLPRTARVIAEGTGAERVEVWLRVGSSWRLSATWPAEGRIAMLPAEEDDLPAFEGVDRAAPVRHQGELLGAVTVRKPASEPLTPGESKLLDDLAGQAGLVLSNARLTAELQARLDEISARAAELRASRQRIVTTQDAERRRLERNIHDGAQQHLVALAVKLRLARGILERDPVKGAETLLEIRGQVDEAAETLGALSLGIYPPLLEERGLAAALEAQAGLGALPVRIDADGVDRLSLELEAAVYFVCLEALQNATKYAQATNVAVRLRQAGDELRFEVVDDGIGFDPASNGPGTGLTGMRDRLSVFGGTVEIESARGRGTTVKASVPLQRVEVTA